MIGEESTHTAGDVVRRMVDDPVCLSWVLLAMNVSFALGALSMRFLAADYRMSLASAIGTTVGSLIGLSLSSLVVYKAGQGKWQWIGWLLAIVSIAAAVSLPISLMFWAMPDVHRLGFYIASFVAVIFSFGLFRTLFLHLQHKVNPDEKRDPLWTSEKNNDTVFGKPQGLGSKKRGQDSAASSAGDAIPIVFGFCNAETVAIQVDQDPLAGAILVVVGMARKSIGTPLDPERLGPEIVRIAMDAGSERLLGADPLRVSVNAALWAGKKLTGDPEGKDNWILTSDDFKHSS